MRRRKKTRKQIRKGKKLISSCSVLYDQFDYLIGTLIEDYIFLYKYLMKTSAASKIIRETDEYKEEIYKVEFRKKYGFIVIVLDHISEQHSHIANLTSHLYP